MMIQETNKTYLKWIIIAVVIVAVGVAFFIFLGGSLGGLLKEKGGGTSSVCGDGICSNDEIDNCPLDCVIEGESTMGDEGVEIIGSVCGDGTCEDGEDNCPLDCTTE